MGRITAEGEDGNPAKFPGLFNFFRLGWVMETKINHIGRGGHDGLLFSLCPLCALWFSKTRLGI